MAQHSSRRAPARHRSSPLEDLKKLPSDLRRPVWRWCFLGLAFLGWAVYGLSVLVLLVTAIATYGWWPIIRKNHRRRRR